MDVSSNCSSNVSTTTTSTAGKRTLQFIVKIKRGKPFPFSVTYFFIPSALIAKLYFYFFFRSINTKRLDTYNPKNIPIQNVHPLDQILCHLPPPQILHLSHRRIPEIRSSDFGFGNPAAEVV